MQLRSGARVGFASSHSYVPTLGSGTQSRGHLEEQELISDSSSSSELETEPMEESTYMHEYARTSERKHEASTSHIGDIPGLEMDFNVKLTFDCTNV